MKISLLNWLDLPWETARGYLQADLEHLQAAINRWNGQTFAADNTLLPATFQGDPTPVPQYVTSEGLASDGVTPAPKWGLVDLVLGVKKRLAYAHLIAATAGSVLVGRRSGSAGDFEEVTLGPGLALAGTVLDTTGASAGTLAVIRKIVSYRA